MAHPYSALSLLLCLALHLQGITSQLHPRVLEIGNDLPCEEDNFSCPRIGNLSVIPLLCYTREELCDGVELCEGGSDEGDDDTLASLECK